MNYIALGTRLKALRERAGLSHHDAADAIGTSLATIYYWEAGTKRPGPDLLARLFDVYAVPPESRAELSQLIALGRHADTVLTPQDEVLDQVLDHADEVTPADRVA